MKENVLTEEFCRSLAEKLSDPFIQIKYNTVSAIINLIISFSEYEIELIFIQNANLLKFIENNFIEYFNNTQTGIKYTDSEINKINKLFKITIDLLILITELYDDSMEKKSKLDFNVIVKSIIHFILTPGDISEEVILNSCLFLSSLLSCKILDVNEDNGLFNFIEFAQKIVFDKNNQANVLINASLISKIFL